MVSVSQKIKELHPDYIIFYKSGSFYKVFGKDAYIISSLFNYNIKIIGNNIVSCGFPLNIIFKIRSEIENKEINYMIIDPRNNYDVDLKEDFRNLNKYQIEFEKAYSRTKRKKKINNIANELTMLIEKPYFKDIIRKIEDILDETREI